MKTKTIFMVLMLSLGIARAQTVIVGGDTLNGNFNLPGGTGTKTYAVTPEWVNLGDNGDGQVCLNDNEAFDGTHAVVPYEGTARLPQAGSNTSAQRTDDDSLTYHLELKENLVLGEWANTKFIKLVIEQTP